MPKAHLVKEVKAFASVSFSKSRDTLRIAARTLNGVEQTDVEKYYR